MCVGSLVGVTYLRYTVLTSSNKSETAVHCCDPALLVLVMLVSRNVFHIVSTLQSIVCRSVNHNEEKLIVSRKRHYPMETLYYRVITVGQLGFDSHSYFGSVHHMQAIDVVSVSLTDT